MRTLATFLFLLFAYCSGAQTIIFQERFDAMPSYSITGWGYEFSGAVPWQCGIPFWVGPCMPPVGGAMSENSGPNKVACFCECGLADPHDSNVLTYTPSINLSADTGVWLKYDSYFVGYVNFASDTEKATVEISTDNGDNWTVIEHVAPSVPYGLFNTHYIKLTGYDHVPNIRIGFRYNDADGHMKGWAIDNVIVFTPAHKDIALLSATPSDTLLSYLSVGTAVNHQATIFNNGLDTIHSFFLHYAQDGGPVKTLPVTGVNVPAFGRLTVTHNIPDTVFTMGRHQVAIWASLTGDSYHNNDSARLSLTGAAFMPSKKLAIESGEGTYNGWSPRNMHYLHMVPLLDVSACLISIHENDPMVDTVYHDFMFNLDWNYVPYILFDRRKKIPLDSFFAYLNVQKQYFGFADVALSSAVADGTVEVAASITPAIDMQGDFRLALVLTEDNVTGTSHDYDQVNNYAGGANGPMGGYETKPNPIPAADISYNYVARTTAPSPDGEPAMLPATLTAGNTYYRTISATIDAAWNIENLRAKVLLIRHDDSIILNSNEIPFPLAIRNANAAFASAALYPNPAQQFTSLHFDMPTRLGARINVADMSGRMVYEVPPTIYEQGHNQLQLPVSSLPNGIYIVTLHTEQGARSLKLNVLH